jgi:hypothetical protein
VAVLLSRGVRAVPVRSPVAATDPQTADAT